MLHLIIHQPDWPQRDTRTSPHPISIMLATHLLVAALYNYDQIVSGRSEEPVGFLDVPQAERERYIAEIDKRGL